MRKLFMLVFAAIAVIVHTGCEPPPAANSNAANTTTANANTAKPTALAPSADMLLALENKAFEAWKNRDGKFFEDFVADNFVGFSDTGERPSRADVIKMIAEHKCEVKSYSLSDPHVTPVTADVAMLTYKATVDFTCNGRPGPSPVTASTLFVRRGDAWKAAYHNEVAITDKPPPQAKKGEAKKGETKPSSDALTDALLAVEKEGWEAWKARDAKRLEATVTPNITFVGPNGKATTGQANVIKTWTEGKCDIKAVDVTDAKGSSISPDVAILTYKGHAEGTCDGQPLLDLWATTVALKDGDKWKAVYVFETPMR